MKLQILTIFLSTLALCSAAPNKRTKRQAYALPDGADILVGVVKTTFACSSDGYYADVDNNCQIFHVCHSVPNRDGSIEQLQWSFLCGNQTLFNQLYMTCSMEQDSIPCSQAPDFYYLNDRLRAGDPTLNFLLDDDIQRAAPFIPVLNRLGGAPASDVRSPIQGSGRRTG